MAGHVINPHYTCSTAFTFCVYNFKEPDVVSIFFSKSCFHLIFIFSYAGNSNTSYYFNLIFFSCAGDCDTSLQSSRWC